MSQPAPNTGSQQPDAFQPGAADQNPLGTPFGLAASIHVPAGLAAQLPLQPPAPTNWSPAAPFDLQGTSRGGGSAVNGQNGATFPANSASDTAAAFPFPLNAYPGVPQGQTVAPSMFVAQPPFLPPITAPPAASQDVWQVALNHIQQVYKDRVAELTNRNSSLENECQTLRRDLGELQRRMAQAESAQQQAELESASRRGRYHPYVQDARRPPASSSSSSSSSLPSNSQSARGQSQGRGSTAAPDYPTHEELMQTSLRARPGRPDPSVEHQPHSAWYDWFRSSGAGNNPPPLPNDSTEWLPDLPLPSIAIRCMGPDAERREDERVEQARRDKAAGKLTVTPLRSDYEPPYCGRWDLEAIATVHQAHNLRHLAIHGRDIHAARLYRHLNVVYQSDPTLHRPEGPAYLIRSWSSDAPRLPFERGSSNSTTRRSERKRAQKTAERDSTSASTGPAIAAASTPSVPSRSSPSGLASAHWIPPAVIPSDAWNTRAFSGLQPQLDVSMKATEVVKAFSTIPTARWPLAMRDDSGAFPPRGETTFRAPNPDDVFAEVFITSITPVVPPGHSEKHSESAFFRGVIELFSLHDLFPWIFEHGKYDELLVEEPSPYPYDCTNLGLHHIVAWAHCCGIGHHSSLRDWVHTYAFNTRHRLEGRQSGEFPQSFTTAPQRASDITKPVNIPLLTPPAGLFPLTKVSYAAADAPSGTAASTSGQNKSASPPSEDVAMASTSS